MANKRTYKPKVEGYVPQAIDGDNDGLVQDGTEFERPVGTEIDELIEVTEIDDVVEVIEETIIEAKPGTYLVQSGENIQTVAAKFLPEGMTRNEYAKKLYKLNGNIGSGQVVKLG